MPEPRRIQLSRAKGWKLTDHTTNYVIVDRRGAWGNPWTVHPFGKQWDVRRPGGGFPSRFNSKNEAQAFAVAQFQRWLTNDAFAGDFPEMGRSWILEHLHELAGKDLCCWCGKGLACHVDAYFEVLAAMRSGGAS